MKFILILVMSIIAFSCSDDIENKQGPGKESTRNQSQPVNPLKPQTKETDKHISGSGQSRISGSPSPSHISGQ